MRVQATFWRLDNVITNMRGLAALLLALGAVSCVFAQVKFDSDIEKLEDRWRETRDIWVTKSRTIEVEKQFNAHIAQFRVVMVKMAEEVYAIEQKATDLNTKTRAGVLRFQIASDCGPDPGSMLKIGKAIVTKYRDNSALAKPIEQFVFVEYLTPAEYAELNLIFAASKNTEVAATAAFANVMMGHFFMKQDLAGLEDVIQRFPNTKAASRAKFVQELQVSLIVGQKLPDLQFDLASGQKIKISELKGKVIILDFWGLWSGGKGAIDEMKELATKHVGKLVIIGINTDRASRDVMRKKLEEIGVTYPNYIVGSPFASMPVDFGVSTYPTKIILDQEGIVRYVPTDPDWHEVLKSLLPK